MNKSKALKNESGTAPSAGSSGQLPALIRRNLAYGMIGIAVIGSYFMTPLPIAMGLTVLATARIWILLREERKEVQSATQSPSAIGCRRP